MPSVDASRLPTAGSAMSGAPDSQFAAEQVSELLAATGVRPDLLLVFVSAHHVPQAERISTILRQRLSPGHMIGVSAESVVGGGLEVEHGPAISILGLELPGARIHTFSSSDFDPKSAPEANAAERLARVIDAGPDLRATFLLADPFSVPMHALLTDLDLGRNHAGTSAPILGGFASAAASPGGNVLFADDRLRRDGLVGVSISGPVRVDALVSQGARPLGSNLIITKARRNLILEIAHRPAVQVLEELIRSLKPRERALLSSGLLMGRVVDERKRRFGRGDYLVRRVTGMDSTSGAVAVDGFFRPGQTICLHVRHAETASSDLSLLLDAQALHERPAAALLITCNGRGTRLFDRPHHDAAAVVKAFAPSTPGEQLSAGGKPISAADAALPMAGFFAAGEIGPIAGRTFVHGFTACVALFRAAEPETQA